MLKNIKTYHWRRLLSDVIVVSLSAILSMLLEKLKNVDTQNLGPTATGATAFIVNKFRQFS